MKMKLKTLAISFSLPVLLLADLAPEAPLGLGVARNAHAIVGAPLTPLSVAGVARRTTRRTVYATSAATAYGASAQQQATAQQQAATAQQQAATAQQQAAVAQQQAQVASPPPPAGAPPIGHIVSALPAGCVSSPTGGVQYFNCSGVYYRPAFQSNNLVYVVAQP